MSALRRPRGAPAGGQFVGHHRLAAARKHHLAYVPVRSAWRAEDAVPVRGVPDEFGPFGHPGQRPG